MVSVNMKLHDHAMKQQDNLVRAVLRWDDCMVEMDGQMQFCGEYFNAMQEAIDRFRATLVVLDLPTIEPLS